MRILEIFGEPISNGGQESFVMNMYEAIDKTKIQFDFFTPYYCDNNYMKNRILELGGKIFTADRCFESKKRKKYFVKELKKFLKQNKYDIVHIHSGSTFVLANGAKIAKKNGSKKIIVHSHASGISNIKSILLKIIFSKKLLKNVTHYLACSNIAAKYRFPNKIIKEKKYIVIKNGIDTEKFKFNRKIRNEYKEKFDFYDNFVIGHVGRMEPEKNHYFLLDVFEKILKNDKSARLLLIGAGSLEENIKNKIMEKKIEDKILVLSKRNDVNKLLQAMDVFVFPSFYEGLGIVAIEAQTSGLPVICSENIPDEANLTDLFIKLNLSDGLDIWVEKILEYKNNKKKDYSKIIKKAGYNSKQSAEHLKKIYME